MFMQFSSRGGAILQDSASSPMFRVMFERNLVIVYDSLYGQVLSLASSHLGNLAKDLLSFGFQDAIGRLFWSTS